MNPTIAPTLPLELSYQDARQLLFAHRSYRRKLQEARDNDPHIPVGIEVAIDRAIDIEVRLKTLLDKMDELGPGWSAG